jgi:hypothetical protein
LATDRTVGRLSTDWMRRGCSGWPWSRRRLVRHAVAEEGVPFRDIAAAIGQRLHLPVTSVTTDEAIEHFGFLAGLVAFDSPASSALTQQLLGWRPEGIGLVQDIAEGRYFDG